MGLLPKNKAVERAQSDKVSIWVMGNPGEGKTTFASQFPNALMINTDGNYTQFDTPAIFLKERMEMPNGGEEWGFNYLIKVIDEFITNKDGYETLVIDLLEDVVRFAEKMVAAKNGKEHIQDVPWGKGTKEVEELMRQLTTKLNSIDMNVIYLSHAIEEATKNVNGSDIIKIVPKDMKPKLVAMIAGRVKLMSLLETITFNNTDENGTIQLDEKGIPMKTSIKVLNFEKSERLPSTVKRFKTDHEYCIATYESLSQIIKGEK